MPQRSTTSEVASEVPVRLPIHVPAAGAARAGSGDGRATAGRSSTRRASVARPTASRPWSPTCGRSRRLHPRDRARWRGLGRPGSLTPVVGVLWVLNRAGASWFVHRDGLFAAEGGYELVPALGAPGLVLPTPEAGRLSVDGLRARAGRGTNRGGSCLIAPHRPLPRHLVWRAYSCVGCVGRTTVARQHRRIGRLCARSRERLNKPESHPKDSPRLP